MSAYRRLTARQTREIDFKTNRRPVGIADRVCWRTHGTDAANTLMRVQAFKFSVAYGDHLLSRPTAVGRVHYFVRQRYLTTPSAA